MTVFIQELLPGAQHLQNLHPLIVHFPIAFLTGSVFFYVLAYGLRREALAKFAFWLLWAGVVTAAMAVWSGLYASEGVMVARSVRSELLDPHKYLMGATLLISILLAVWAAISGGFPGKCRIWFLAACFVLLAVMVKGADYGGRMVYEYNAGGNACGQPIEFAGK